VYKITYKTYLNDRLKEVNFHGKLTHPLYVQVTHERKTIFFKSYYFELFSKSRYFLNLPGLKPKGPELNDVIEKENEVIRFIIQKHQDNFSLELFKQSYARCSKDLCDELENGFMKYLHTFLWDKGMPAIGDLVMWGGRNIVAFDLVRDLKKAFKKELYDELIENSFYYAPPYLPLYGFMQQTKRWPMLCLTVMEWEKTETQEAFRKYVDTYYPGMDKDELVVQINKWPKYL
jgi:hypothetical protein